MAIFPGSAIPSAISAYDIDNSLRFNDADSAYLSRTPTTAGNTKIWSLSFWRKQESGSNTEPIFTCGSYSGGLTSVYFSSGGNMVVSDYSGGFNVVIYSNGVYRDPSAWAHYLVVWNTTEATSTDRVKIFKDGVSVVDASASTFPSEDFAGEINTTGLHMVGRDGSASSDYGRGYIAEMFFIDGTALAASDFGELDSDTNQWIPLDSDDVKDAVTFGTNGFYQKYGSTELANSFTDSATYHNIHTVTAYGNTHTDTAIKKFGTASGQWDGSGDYLSVPASNDWHFGDGDFTIDFWIYRSNPSDDTWDFVITQPTDGSTYDYFGTYHTGTTGTYYIAANGEPGGAGAGSDTFTISEDTWTHIAICQHGDKIYHYKDGVSVNGVGVGKSSTVTWPTPTVPLRIGYQQDVLYYNGYADEIRISKGIARFPNGASFDVATSEYTADKYDVLLLHCNGSNDGTTFTDSSWVGVDGPSRHTITDNGDVKNVRSVGNFECDYLVVAGGGGGGGSNASYGGGGAGAGGYLAGATNLWNGISYAITVGDGGTAAAIGAVGGDGEDSKLGNVFTAAGGGGGGGGGTRAGSGGGSGGGSSGNNGGGGSASQGYAGGNSTASTRPGSGGGGSGAVGVNNSSASWAIPADGSAGGAGTSNSITGSAVVYAGGGGSGGFIQTGYSPNSATGGSGGTGGGGAGGSPTESVDGTPVNGTPNTGGGAGGGGGNWAGTGLAGATGGSGIVIIRYKSATNLATGGTITTDGDYKVHSFTADGTFEITSATRPGTSSIEFDGTGDYLTLPDSPDWQLGGGTGDFTWEAWIYPKNTTDEERWTGQWEDDNNRWSIELYLGKINFYMKSGGVVVGSFLETNAGVVTQDQWNHVAFVRSGSTPYIFVDGVSVAVTTSTAFGTMIDASSVLAIGRYWVDLTNQDFTGYMDEIRLSNTARYTGAFTPSTTAFTADANTLLLIHSNWDGGLGADSSGNYNTFTATNLVATDSMIDTPTNSFCTFNPLYVTAEATQSTYLEGNLEVVSPSPSANGMTEGTIGIPSSGKWYWEHYTDDETSQLCGIAAVDFLTATATNSYMGFGKSRGYYSASGNKVGDAVYTSYGDSYTDGDIIGVAVDMENGALYFAKNNTWQDSGDPTSGASKTGAAFTDLLTSADFDSGIMPGWSDQNQGTSDTTIGNFGQDSSFAGNVTAQGNQDGKGKGDFYYEPPTDYLALCSDNLPSPEIALPGENFNTILYDDGAGAKTGVGFQPDLVWVKSRGSAYDHKLTDTVRGVTKALIANDNSAETTDSTGLTAFGADGFTVGADTDYSDTTGTGMIAWNWKAGGTPTATNVATTGVMTSGSVFQDGVSNTSFTPGSTIYPTKISANTTSGFSIITYTGTGVNATIAHGLSQAPEMVVQFDLEDGQNRFTFHKDLTAAYVIYLNLDEFENAGATEYPTAPSSSVVSIGTGNLNNLNKDGLLYCFHSVEGYSKIGKYEGNADADGAFIYTGFSPKYFLSKNNDATQNWTVQGYAPGYNPEDRKLFPNETSVEGTGSNLDFLSNGVKWRVSYNEGNGNYTYIYMAFAEWPFKTANAR